MNAAKLSLGAKDIPLAAVGWRDMGVYVIVQPVKKVVSPCCDPSL